MALSWRIDALALEFPSKDLKKKDLKKKESIVYAFNLPAVQQKGRVALDEAYDADCEDESSEKSTDVGWDTSSQASDEQIVDQGSAYVKVEFLKSIGFSSVCALDLDGKSALHRAAKVGNAEAAQAILDDEDFEHVNAKDSTILKCTVLHEASAAGNTKIVRMLMDHERFVHTNARDRNGRTCLHYTAAQGSFEAVEAILSNPRFASIGVKDCQGFTAQQRAKANGHDAIAQYIRARIPSAKPPGLSILPDSQGHPL